MKANRPNNKVVTTLAILFFGVLLLSSCLKNNDDFTPSVSYFSIVNGYPGDASIDYYLDNQKANVQPLLYKQASAYLEVFSGDRRLTVTSAGTTNVVADGAIRFSPSVYYSVFLARKSVTNADSLSGFVVVDDLTLPTTNKAKIRFANLTPGATKIDVNIKGVQDTLFGNKAFSSISAFKEVDPSVSALEIRQAGQAAVKLEVPVTLQAGKIYTLSTNGLWDGTAGTDVFATQLTTHER